MGPGPQGALRQLCLGLYFCRYRPVPKIRFHAVVQGPRKHVQCYACIVHDVQHGAHSHSRSSKVIDHFGTNNLLKLESPYATSYWCSVATRVLSCTVAIWQVKDRNCHLIVVNFPTPLTLIRRRCSGCSLWEFAVNCFTMKKLL